MTNTVLSIAQTWECGAPRSQGNAFSVPKRVAPEPKKTKTRRKPERAVTTAWMTEPMSGLSERAKKELMVPTARVSVVLEGSTVARIRVIPQAQRSNT